MRGGNDASVHSAMWFEAFPVAATLSITSCVGCHFPCDVFFASGRKTTSKRQSFCSFVRFLVLGSNLLTVFGKRNEQD